MSKRRTRATTAPRPAPAPTEPALPRLLDRWWVGLLAALWVVGIVALYYHLQITRLVRVLTR